MRTGQVHPVRLTEIQQRMVADDGSWARACRDVWNAALDERLGALRAAGGRTTPAGWWPSYASQCRELTQAKKVAPWLGEAPHHVLQQTLKDLDRAWVAWRFDRRSGRPRWRARKRAARNWWAPSYRFPDRSQFTIRRLSSRWGQVKLPKLGRVRFRWTRAVPKGGTVTSVTLKQDRVGEWTVAFAVDLPDVEVVHRDPGSAVGVDRGVVVAVATSDGQLLDPGPTLTPGEQERLRRLERRRARQQPGSANRTKTRQQIARLRRRQGRRRAEFAHQTSVRLADRYETVVVEALDVRAMARSATGTVEQPGSNVAAKRGLNRAIIDKGWGMLTSCLAYKTVRSGGRLIEVDPKHTSRTCHACGHVDPRSRENQARWVCVACRHGCHADVNAACNILARGHPTPGAMAAGSAGGRPVAACGDLQPLGGSAKQEPSRRQVTHAA